MSVPARPDEAKAFGIEIGSPVTMVGPYRELAGRRVAAKAMDNRIGCVVLIRLLEALQGRTPPVTIVGVVTVQEEVGLRGARMVAETLNATAVLGLDITSTGDTPDCDGLSDTTIKLGAGPSISFFDEIEEAYAASLIGIVGHPSLNERLVEVAERTSIPDPVERPERRGS